MHRMARTQRGRPQRRGRYRSFGRSRSRSKKGERRSNAPKKKTTLAEHVHHVGSTRNASDYITVANFLINCIEREYIDAGDIGEALRKGVEPDWQAPQPTLEISKVDPTTGKDDAEKAKLQKELERDKEQFAKEWDMEHKTFSRRKDNCRQNQIKAAALLHNQSSLGMRTKLKSRSDWCWNVQLSLDILILFSRASVLSHSESQGSHGSQPSLAVYFS